jgi:hypothetical protein
MNKQNLFILFLFACTLCSCSISIKVCNNHFEKYEAKYFIQDNPKEEAINNPDYYEDTVRHICSIYIRYPSICGLKNKTIEDSINRMLKELFFEWAYCCLDNCEWISQYVDMYVGFKTNYVTNNMVSITLHMSTTCGAGGGNVMLTYNIDLKNGKRLENDDILKPIFRQEYEQEMLKLWNTLKQDKYYKNGLSDDCFYSCFLYGFEIAFTKDTVIFVFNRSGMCGPYTIVKKKKEVKNIIKSKYL